jgi:hypothetical protein
MLIGVVTVYGEMNGVPARNLFGFGIRRQFDTLMAVASTGFASARNPRRSLFITRDVTFKK